MQPGMEWARVEVESKEATRGERLRMALSLVFTHLLPGIAMLVLSRATILEGMRPFGIAFFAAGLACDLSPASLIAGAVIGPLLAPGGYMPLWLQMVSHAFVLLAYVVLWLFKRRNPAPWMVGVGCALLVAVPQAALGTHLLYDLLFCALSGAISGFAALAFTVGLRARPVGSRVITTEETVSFVLFASVLILGLLPLQIGVVSVSQVMAVLLCVLVAHTCGAGAGAASGLVLGLVLSLGAPERSWMAPTFGLGGLLAGGCRGLQRPGSALGFLAGAFLISAYAQSTFPLWDCLVGCALIFAIPRALIEELKEKADLFTGRRAMAQRNSIQAGVLLSGQLQRFAAVFSAMSAAISSTKEKKETEYTAIDIAECAAGQVCGDCGLRARCWQRDREHTEDALEWIAQTVMEGGQLVSEEMPELLRRLCSRPDMMLGAIEELAQQYRERERAQRAMQSCRSVIGEQLEELTQLVETLAAQLQTGMESREALSQELLEALYEEGVQAKGVWVQTKEDATEVYMEGVRTGERGAAQNALYKVLSKRMLVDGDGKEWIAREAPLIAVQAAFAQKAKGEPPCGDTALIKTLPSGRVLLAVSDGMGSGAEAASQSHMTIGLLDCFFSAGLDEPLVLRTINQLMGMQSNGESFSTIDICLIDPRNGEAQFVKVGAAFSCVVSATRGRVIRSTSLPLGILDDIAPIMEQSQLKPGDRIIMVSDGVASNGGLRDEEWLIDAARLFDAPDPQDIADALLREAQLHAQEMGQRYADDQTVLVACVE